MNLSILGKINKIKIKKKRKKTKKKTFPKFFYIWNFGKHVS